jgi:hypothetical protein
MKVLYLSLTFWRWNPAVVIRRVRGQSGYNDCDFATAVKIARTLLI